METIVVKVENTFFDYFFRAEGNYYPPVMETQPKSFLKTDNNGLLYVLEKCGESEVFPTNLYKEGKNTSQNMTFLEMRNFIKSNGDSTDKFELLLDKLERFVRFDEINIPIGNRRYSPSKVNTISYNINPQIGLSFQIKGCFLTEITDWDKNFVFISYFNTRDFNSKIASLNDIENNLKDRSISEESFYLSNDRKSLYIGTLDSGKIVPKVYSDNISVNLPSSFFITCKKNSPITQIIDTRQYNSSYGPVIDTIVGTKGEKNYLFIRIPLLYILGIRYNFPVGKDGKFSPLSMSVANIFKNGWQIADVEEFSNALTPTTTVKNYKAPISQFKIVLGHNEEIMQYAISGTTLNQADSRNGNDYLLWIAEGGDISNISPDAVLDLDSIFGKISKGSSVSSKKYYLFLLIILTIILLIILFIVFKNKV